MADKPHVEKIAEKRREPPNRITAIFNIAREYDGENPISIDPIISQLNLSVKEDHYSRRIRVNQDWIPLDLGHLRADQVGLVVIENLEGRFLDVNPTEGERKEASKRIIQVSFGDPTNASLAFPAPASLPYVGYPQDASRIALRCPVGVAKCRIWVFPR